MDYRLNRVSNPRLRLRDGEVFLLSTLLLCSNCLRADDWPQWRGQHREGISQETGLLKEWPKQGPKLLWEVKELGSGYSTPAVVGQRLYVLGNDGLENEFVQALAVSDGKLLWQAPFARREWLTTPLRRLSRDKPSSIAARGAVAKRSKLKSRATLSRPRSFGAIPRTPFSSIPRF